MIDLQINAKFASYFPVLDYGQETQLEKSLRDDLTSEPILWWHNPNGQDEILDGHNRYKIAKRLKLEEIRFHEKHFESEDEALLFVIRTQTTRRNIDNHKVIVQEAVNLEIKLGKKKTQAVEDVAEQMGISERSAWDAIKPVSATQQFFDDKKAFERDLERVRNKEVEKLKQRAQREGWAEDEDKLESEWGVVEAEIQTQFAEASSRLEGQAVAIQEGAEAEGRKPVTGGKRRRKKSTATAAEKRNAMKKALKLVGELQDLLYLWDMTVGIEADDMRVACNTFGARIKDEQEADAKIAKKKKFGR